MPIRFYQLFLLYIPEFTTVVVGRFPKRERYLIPGAVDHRVDVIEVTPVGEDDAARGGYVFLDDWFPFYPWRWRVTVPSAGGTAGLIDRQLGRGHQFGGYVVP